MLVAVHDAPRVVNPIAQLSHEANSLCNSRERCSGRDRVHDREVGKDASQATIAEPEKPVGQVRLGIEKEQLHDQSGRPEQCDEPAHE